MQITPDILWTAARCAERRNLQEFREAGLLRVK
jgi:hypothetical protein